MRGRFHRFAIIADVPEWRNWQTHAPDTCTPATVCGFESRFAHALPDTFDSANRSGYDSITCQVYVCQLRLDAKPAEPTGPRVLYFLDSYDLSRRAVLSRPYWWMIKPVIFPLASRVKVNSVLLPLTKKSLTLSGDVGTAGPPIVDRIMSTPSRRVTSRFTPSASSYVPAYCARTSAVRSHYEFLVEAPKAVPIRATACSSISGCSVQRGRFQTKEDRLQPQLS